MSKYSTLIIGLISTFLILSSEKAETQSSVSCPTSSISTDACICQNCPDCVSQNNCSNCQGGSQQNCDKTKPCIWSCGPGGGCCTPCPNGTSTQDCANNPCACYGGSCWCGGCGSEGCDFSLQGKGLKDKS